MDDILHKNFIFPIILLRAHFFIHFLSILFCVLNYVYLFCYENKYFFATFMTFHALLLILILQMLCLLKSICFNSLGQLKCSLNLYLLISLIFLILIIINYILIFQIFHYNKYRITLLCLGLMYYILDGMFFLFDCFVIFQLIKRSISERILMQINQNGNIENKNTKNDTQTSEKTNNNENYEKESTIYIIYDNNINNKNNNANIKKVNNNIFSEINNDNSFCNNEGNIMTIKRNNKKNFSNNKYKTFYNHKGKIMNEEDNSSKSFDEININLHINNELK